MFAEVAGETVLPRLGRCRRGERHICWWAAVELSGSVLLMGVGRRMRPTNRDCSYDQELQSYVYASS
jgi:hypothetical protein